MIQSVPFRLLIAEDNEADEYLIRNSLSAAGLEFEATVASNGEEALAMICHSPDCAGFDGIILDLNLTTHNGLDILRHVRETPALAATRVVILTSSSSPRDQHLAMSLGADGFWHKPMDLFEFMQLGRQIAALLTHADEDRAAAV